MIGIIFQYGGEVIETRILGNNLFFRTSTYGTQFVPFENIHLSKEGVEKEYPDLKGDENWRTKSIQRFKDEMNKLGSENKIADYVIKDLAKYGYVPKYKQRQGHRIEVIHAS